MTVRTAQLSDAGEIARLTHQLGYTPDPARVTASLARTLSRADHRVFVADAGGQLAGWVLAVLADYLDVEPYVSISGLVVDREHRRRGIGALLLSQAEQWAVEQGYATVRLSSSQTRTAAHRFYERVGYTNIKTQYSFAKPVGGADPAVLRAFVPDPRG
jgi:ribosomal protein S18 acetylase RimI-like enzyme